MTTTQAAPAATPKFDNHGQYSRTGILRYEMIFGEGLHQHRRRGDHRRPVRPARARRCGRACACSTWAAASAEPRFTWLKTYGAKVTGIDLAEEMVAIALERTAQLGMGESVKFLLGDVLETEFPEPFDIIWSRDAFMHIPDKPRLFSPALSALGAGRPARDHRLRPRQDAGLARVRALYREDRLSRRRAARVRPAARGRRVRGCRRRRCDGAVRRDSRERGRPAGRPTAASSWPRSRKPTSTTWSSAGR